MRKPAFEMVKINGIVKLKSSKLVIYPAHKIEPRHEKTNILVSDLVRHKPGCTAKEDGQRL